MNVHVVIGANYGDEGKGLVSGCLARDAFKRGDRTLTVFYNGTSQRAHTFEGQVRRCTAAGTGYGSDTFYHERFVVDPISVLITRAKPIIDGRCRVILPCDVIRNRATERGREYRHGSCGFGLFEAVRRFTEDPETRITASDMLDSFQLYKKLRKAELRHGAFDDEIYNLHNFMLAADYIRTECPIQSFEETVKNYDTVIFEGGQGLLLDQGNEECFPHLTPSCTGSTMIADDILKVCEKPELYYVSRSYMTRHGNGPMESECTKEDINGAIVDETNQENEFQGALRFGKIDTYTLEERILKDAELYGNRKSVNIVLTQLNYTDGKIASTDGMKAISDIRIGNILLSDRKDKMEQYKKEKSI